MRCMTAICPAGPPKDRRPMRIQVREASVKETGGWELTGATLTAPDDSSHPPSGSGSEVRRHAGIGGGLFRQQRFDPARELLVLAGIVVTRGRRSKACVDGANRAVPAHEHRGGPGVEVQQLRHLLPHLLRRTGL